jgi:hypothetical protein
MRWLTVVAAVVCSEALANRLHAQVPLLSFSDIGSPSARADTVFIKDCAVIVTLEGTTVHDDGARVGANVVLHGDTLDVRIGAFMTRDLSARTPERTDWNLVIGALRTKRYLLRVFKPGDAAETRIARWIDLRVRKPGCPA